MHKSVSAQADTDFFDVFSNPIAKNVKIWFEKEGRIWYDTRVVVSFKAEWEK